MTIGIQHPSPIIVLLQITVQYFLHTVHSLIRRSSPPSPSPQQHEQHEQHPTILLLKKLLHHWMALHNPHVSPGENPPLRKPREAHRYAGEEYFAPRRDYQRGMQRLWGIWRRS